jgi:hypothetical protein
MKWSTAWGCLQPTNEAWPTGRAPRFASGEAREDASR